MLKIAASLKAQDRPFFSPANNCEKLPVSCGILTSWKMDIRYIQYGSGGLGVQILQ